ncbi:MAG: protein-L-isoaspartate(D-aspartate) O-methyltransferase [Anaerolineales bacterium]|jgi:protein-L-isoaspartate(D-aspartate) O-methyltransferase|nr:protein-L-isoaspartate(D-aspartate) O-methyltransferase [Anaerolineales bacterium]
MGTPDEEDSWNRLRRRMVTVQLMQRGIDDPRVLQAMRAVPRHRFVPPELQADAYEDMPLPIGNGQTISQPYIVARMTELLQLTAEDSVLEIGAGSGYQAAVLARLARHVFTVECIPALAQAAAKRVRALGVENVEVTPGDGGAGLRRHAPFAAILVSAAAPRVPPPLLQQLAEGGRLVAPIGPRQRQRLQRWVKKGRRCKRESLTPVRFVPLTGEWGVDN